MSTGRGCFSRSLPLVVHRANLTPVVRTHARHASAVWGGGDHVRVEAPLLRCRGHTPVAHRAITHENWLVVRSGTDSSGLRFFASLVLVFIFRLSNIPNSDTMLVNKFGCSHFRCSRSRSSPAAPTEPTSGSRSTGVHTQSSRTRDAQHAQGNVQNVGTV